MDESEQITIPEMEIPLMQIHSIQIEVSRDVFYDDPRSMCQSGAFPSLCTLEDRITSRLPQFVKFLTITRAPVRYILQRACNSYRSRFHPSDQSHFASDRFSVLKQRDNSSTFHSLKLNEFRERDKAHSCLQGLIINILKDNCTSRNNSRGNFQGLATT